MSTKKKNLFIFQYFKRKFLSEKAYKNFFLFNVPFFKIILYNYCKGGINMARKKDIVDLLFEKKEEDMAFKMKDNLLTQSRQKIYKTSYKLDEFIKANVPDDIRTELQNLISNRNEALYDSYYREGQLFYRNGIIDGLYLKSLDPNKK